MAFYFHKAHVRQPSSVVPQHNTGWPTMTVLGTFHWTGTHFPNVDHITNGCRQKELALASWGTRERRVLRLNDDQNCKAIDRGDRVLIFMVPMSRDLRPAWNSSVTHTGNSGCGVTNQSMSTLPRGGTFRTAHQLVSSACFFLFFFNHTRHIKFHDVPALTVAL